MVTFSAKPADIKREWITIDATDLVLGRLASYIAFRLRGKHRPIYTPHIDCGDYIVVTNAEKVYVTADKDKPFYWHTGWPGGIKSSGFKERIAGKKPESVLEKAVERMLPKGTLGRDMLKKLKVYKGPEHPHVAQNPSLIDFAKLNEKNAKR